MPRLTTRIVLLASGMPAAERAIAAMAAGIARRTHGFGPDLLLAIEPEDNRFAYLIDRVTMDPHGSGILEPKAPLIEQEVEPYSFIVRFIHGEKPPGVTRVEVRIVTSELVKKRGDECYREVGAWLARPAQAVVHSGMWILAGNEEKDRATQAVFLRPELIAFAERFLNSAKASLATVVLSIVGFEYYLLDAYRKTAAGGYRRPLELAYDVETVRKIMLALIRSAPHFRRLVSRCAAWQEYAKVSDGRRPLALLQPISANGFFADDGAPNIDRVMGLPLLTLDGMVDDRKGASPFPRTDDQLPDWVPYLTADPMMEIVLRRKGDLGIVCEELEKYLPALGDSRQVQTTSPQPPLA
jgi:hypothetical protein